MEAVFTTVYELAPQSPKSDGLYLGLEVTCHVSIDTEYDYEDRVILPVIGKVTPIKIAPLIGGSLLEKGVTFFGDTPWVHVAGELRSHIEKKIKYLDFKDFGITSDEAIEELQG